MAHRQYQQAASPPRQPTTTADWLQPFSTPVRRWRIAALAVDACIFVSVVSVITATGAVPTSCDGPPPSITSIQYQALAQPVFVPSAEDVTPDKWYIELSRPTPRKPGLAAARQQTLALGPAPPETVSWFAALNEPVRRKAGLHASRQQSSAVTLQPTERACRQWFKRMRKERPWEARH